MASSSLVVDRRQRLHLDPDVPVSHQIQDLAEQRQGLAVADAELPGLGERELGNRSQPGNLRVVVHDDPAVSRRVDIELDAVGIEH